MTQKKMNSKIQKALTMKHMFAKLCYMKLDHYSSKTQ